MYIYICVSCDKCGLSNLARVEKYQRTFTQYFYFFYTNTAYTNTLITTHLYLADKVQNSETSVYIFWQI